MTTPSSNNSINEASSLQFKQEGKEGKHLKSTVTYQGRTYSVIHSKSVKLEKIEKQLFGMIQILDGCKDVKAVRYENIQDPGTLGVKIGDETFFHKVTDLNHHPKYQNIFSKINSVFNKNIVSQSVSQPGTLPPPLPPRHSPNTANDPFSRPLPPFPNISNNATPPQVNLPPPPPPFIDPLTSTQSVPSSPTTNSKQEIEKQISTIADEMHTLGTLRPSSTEWNKSLQDLEKKLSDFEANWIKFCEQKGIKAEKKQTNTRFARISIPPELKFISHSKAIIEALKNPHVTSSILGNRHSAKSWLDKSNDEMKALLQPLYTSIESTVGPLTNKKLSDTELKRTFYELMESAFKGNGQPVDIELLKRFFAGCNFPTLTAAGAVVTDDVFNILESFLGKLDSDVVKKIIPPDRAPEGYTAIAANLGVNRALGNDSHAYCLLRTPNGGKHAFSHGQDVKYWEGTLGSEYVDKQTVNEAFVDNTDRIYNSGGFDRGNNRTKPKTECVVYVKNEHAKKMTEILETFHDLPWFDGKCQALAAVTLAMIMQKAKSLATT